MKDNNKPVLYIDDDEVDVMKMQRAFSMLNIASPLVIAENGEAGLEHLHNKGNLSPCLILLDLNMPKMGGLEFLKIIKQDPELRRIPVVILTTSESEQDKLGGYDLGAAGFMLKPGDYKKYVDTIKTIKLYWSLSEISA